MKHYRQGGRVYNLRMSFNALAMFEEDIGPIGDYFNTSAPKSIAGCRGVIWEYKPGMHLLMSKVLAWDVGWKTTVTSVVVDDTLSDTTTGK